MGKYYELNTSLVIEYIKNKIDFFDPSAQIKCEEIGDGNLNLVFWLKDETNNKNLIVKQALPYLRVAGKDWPLNISRGEMESKILNIQYELTDGQVPKVFLFDSDMCCMVMEYLGGYTIMRTGLLELEQYPKFANQITDFLVKTLLYTSDVVLNHETKKKMASDFINPELCTITESLVYTEPFGCYKRNNVEEFLIDFAKKNIENDSQLKLEVAKLKFDFMNNNQALLHGDFHTGSIFVSKEDTKVIDPEFSFFGPMAYDIGALIANLIMNYISVFTKVTEQERKKIHLKWLLNTIAQCIDLFSSKFIAEWGKAVNDDMAKVQGFREWYLNDVLVNSAGVAGCEMIRRTVGFAHVKDLDDIPDINRRAWAKKTNILIAKYLIINRTKITKGNDYISLIKKFIKGE